MEQGQEGLHKRANGVKNSHDADLFFRFQLSLLSR
jgi:hypothetical protein